MLTKTKRGGYGETTYLTILTSLRTDSNNRYRKGMSCSWPPAIPGLVLGAADDKPSNGLLPIPALGDLAVSYSVSQSVSLFVCLVVSINDSTAIEFE